MKNVMNETDTKVSNDIFKMYMTDAQYERVSEAEEKEGRELSDDEFWRLRRKLY